MSDKVTHSRLVRCTMLVVVLGQAPAAAAQDAGIEFFEKKIRPVLVNHCYECHATTAKKVRGGLLLDSRDGIRKGGDSGKALEPGKPGQSLLMKALEFADDTPHMPPKGRLPPGVIADFKAWIAMGAPDPRDRAAAISTGQSWQELVRKRRSWWSLQPVTRPVVPQPRNASWSSDPIDRFLLARLEEKDVAPAPPADPRTLIRRLSLVLTGLPPTPADVDAFVRKYEARPGAALASRVDALLNSPHFGERWARHWMDVVRFSETHGNEWNYEVHHAWRYRDYLIRAFNSDLPFAQLVREHLAGDLLPRPRWHPSERFNESVIGTAFYRFGEVNHDDCIALRQIGYDLADNQIDTLSKAFQGLTIACARCHDHKLDAVSMRDYYRVLGMLRSSRCVSHTIDAPEVNADVLRKMRSHKDAIRHELAAAWLSATDGIGRELAATFQQAEQKWPRALADDKMPLENPLAPWRLLLAEKKKGSGWTEAWKNVAAQFTRESSERAQTSKSLEMLADFQAGSWPDWQVSGQGLREPPARHGEFVIQPAGKDAISAVLPAGCYTHLLSDKLNGTLRSPILDTQKKFISFHVLGRSTSAVRLVSNNCQLNYRNYRALVSDDWHWITFPVPEDSAGLRVYAEIMTKMDNPKFPDQLGSLGGDLRNDRIPWEKAAANPRSHFGVTKVVLHDEPAPPKPAMTHCAGLLNDPPATPAEFASRYAARLHAALQAWDEGQATADDVCWLDAFVKAGLVSNRCDSSAKLQALLADYRQLDGQLALPQIVPGLADFGPGIKQPVFVRGDCQKPGETVAPGYVEVLSPSPLTTAGSGRLELANLIAARRNPLTARVLVNRLWHHVFGAGLVRTVDDFGHVGDTPAHPELLDYLAARFMDEGWSIKRLLRALVLTRTFQMSHEPAPAAQTADPENRLLHHYPARRLEAEAIRDAILAASGRLDPTLFGPSIPAYRDKDNEYRRLFRGPLDGNGRRSIYIKFTLMEAPKFLEAFNLPGGKVTQGRRDRTDVPAQALAMLNDPFVLQQAEVWSRRLQERKADSVAGRLEAMFQTALGRPPDSAEVQRFEQFVGELAKLHETSDVLTSAPVWRDVAHTLFNLQEFISIP